MRLNRCPFRPKKRRRLEKRPDRASCDQPVVGPRRGLRTPRDRRRARHATAVDLKYCAHFAGISDTEGRSGPPAPERDACSPQGVRRVSQDLTGSRHIRDPCTSCCNLTPAGRLEGCGKRAPTNHSLSRPVLVHSDQSGRGIDPAILLLAAFQQERAVLVEVALELRLGAGDLLIAIGVRPRHELDLDRDFD